MKKRITFLTALLSIPCLLTGCGAEENATRVSLLFGTKEYTAETAVTPTSHMKKIEDESILENMVNGKENFVLVVLGDEHETCGCWNTFHQNNIVRYQQETDILFYYMYKSEIKKDYGLDTGIAKATVAIFKDGKVAYQHCDAPETTDFYKDYAAFRSWMNDRVSLPRVHFVSRDQLSALYDETKPFTIYFSRQTCGDCAYMQNTSYRAYYESHPTNIEDSYIIDMDAIGISKIIVDGKIYHRSDKEDASPEQKAAQAQYNAFKEEFGLTESKENPAGYALGYVPAIFHINPEGNGKKIGDVIDMAGVFYNDTVKDGLITDSYFTKSRLALESTRYLRESKVEHKILQGLKAEGTRREVNAKYHDPILRAFLDAAVGTL